jgi:hypothetical protein
LLCVCELYRKGWREPTKKNDAHPGVELNNPKQYHTLSEGGDLRCGGCTRCRRR